MVSLKTAPISFKEAKAYIAEHHRHHLPPQGWKFGIAAYDGDKLVGVVTCGRPVARCLDDGFSLEVTRLCTDGTKNACSFLYAAARRAARELGYKKILTYILDSEPGVTLEAAGWKFVHTVKGRSWSTEKRPREDKHPTVDKRMYASEIG